MTPPHGSVWRAGVARTLVIVSLAVGGGCTTDEVRVEKAVLSDQATYEFPFVTASQPKTRFSTDDEQVALWLTFDINFVGAYLVFDVEWIAPGGFVYRRDPLRPPLGSHRQFIATLPIRGAEAAHLPGRWIVRVFLLKRLLVERDFELVGAEPEPLRAELPSGVVRCPPLGQPPGRCVDHAPQE